MQTFKEHHHTLLVTLFLIGVLLVAGSFEARLPDVATAATTLGQQSALVSTQWYVTHQYSAYGAFTTGLNRNLSVTFTGEIRKGGNLITSDTVLRLGDTVSLTLIETASYVAIGSAWDTPPALWAGNPQEPSLFETACLPPSGQVPNGQHIIYPVYHGQVTNPAPFGGSSAPFPYCALTAVKPPSINLNTSGMNCGSFTTSELGPGVRQLSASCIVTTLGPQSSVSMNIDKTSGRALNRFLILDKEAATTNHCNAIKNGNNYSSSCGSEEEESCNASCNQYDLSIGCIDMCGQGLGYGVSGFSLERTNQNQLVLDSLLLGGASLNWNIDVGTSYPSPTLTFIGAPTTITAGQSATLTWSSQNTTSCAASNGWSGAKAVSGNENITPPSTTSYTLSCTGAGGSVSSSVTITVTTTPTPNQPPVADAKISATNSNFTDSITVVKGVPTTIYLSATDSSDPDGWTHPQQGVSNGGNCQWNSDLNQGSPTFEQTINNPASPSACNISLGTKTFNDAPGAYTYQVLKITDNKSAVSNIDTVTINVLPPSGFSCNSQNQCVFGGGGASCLTNAGCPGGGGGGGCIGNCGGGGGGGGGGCADQTSCPSVTNPTASGLGSDTSFFCPSHQVQTNWSYSDPNNNPQSSFRVQVDDNSDFSSMIIDVYKDSSDKLYIAPANVLAFATKYYFRVAVKDSTGAWSNWSSSANFTTPANCLVPDFALNSSNNITVNVTGTGSGASNTSKITVTPFSGFNAAVNLSAISISPNLPGISYNINPSTLNQSQYSSGSTFKVTIPGATAPGNYVVTIKGEGGNPILTRTINVILKVNSTSPVFREI